MATNIAILILAHKNPEQLNRLIEQLACDFSVYVHADLKMNPKIISNDAQVISLYDVSWGSFEQIAATEALFRVAHKNNHQRYLFISGQDLPLKNNLQISKFFSNNPHNYLDYKPLPNPSGWGGGQKLKRLSLFWLNESRKKQSITRKVKKNFKL